MTKIFSNKSTYEGEFKDNEPHGKGVNTLPNGNVQEGEFREGEFFGFGKMSWSDGGWYEGEWYNGEMQVRAKSYG